MNDQFQRGKSKKMDSPPLFSKEIDKIYEILEATPEIRWERVNYLKKLISSGQYYVPEELIAERMIQEFLSEFIE